MGWSAREVRALDGVGHGSLLARRYRLEERVRTGPDGSLWRAIDETLDRQVSIRVIRPGHRYTADVVDAARRAALVEDARLVRVLDVGDSAGTAYIVSEYLSGRTLEDLLVVGPIPAETVRRVIGEAAQALDRASARGLHHLRLTPSSLVIAPDGTIKVVGTAVEAALAGAEQDEDPVGAARTDAIGLVSVLYAGLSGRWPGPADGPLGPAPRITGRAVPPGDLVAGVPADLDTLCAVTLGPHDDGPASPGELAEQLAPWASAAPLTMSRGLSVSPLRPAPDSVEALASREPGAPVVRTEDGSSGAGASGRSPERKGNGGTSTTGAVIGASGGAAAPETVGAAGTTDGPAGSSGRNAPGSAATGRTATAPAPASRNAPRRTPPPSPPAAPTGSSVAVAASGRIPAPSTDGRSGTSAGRPGPPRTPPGNSWSIFEETPGHDEPLGPFMPPAPLSRPPRDQIRLVMVVLAGVVVLALVLTLFSLRGLGSASPLVNTSVSPPTPATGVTTSAAGAAPPPASGASNPSGAAIPGAPPASALLASGSGQPPEITGIEAIDPQGDGQENGTQATRAIDGDATTNWRSDHYQSATFGGLKKGLGLYLRLSGSGLIHAVEVTMPGTTAGTVQLLSSPGPGLDNATVRATADSKDGTAVLTPAQPFTDDSLVLWFTSLPQQSNGEYRLIVPEILVR
jgi:hypothetical protein